MISSCIECGSTDIVPKFRRTLVSAIRDPLWYHECAQCRRAYLVEDSDLFFNNRVADVIIEYRMKVHKHDEEYM